MLILHKPSSINKKRNGNKGVKVKRYINLGDVSEALDGKNDAVIVAFFQQGYAPEKDPLPWVKMIIDLDKLNKKYELWKSGLL